MRLVFLSGLAALLGCAPPAHPGSPGPCPPSTRAHQGGNAGARVLSCQLPDATLHGPWQFVSDESWVAGRYDHGLPDGRFTQRTLDGRVLGHYDIHRGDGVELRWYASGALESEVTLRRGLRDGQRVVYRPDDIAPASRTGTTERSSARRVSRSTRASRRAALVVRRAARAPPERVDVRTLASREVGRCRSRAWLRWSTAPR